MDPTLVALGDGHFKTKYEGEASRSGSFAKPFQTLKIEIYDGVKKVLEVDAKSPKRPRCVVAVHSVRAALVIKSYMFDASMNMRHELTILAYEMKGAPVSVPHGAPLRMRCENELGFKMVKWVVAIEFVASFVDSAPARAAINEHHEFYGRRMSI